VQFLIADTFQSALARLDYKSQTRRNWRTQFNGKIENGSAEQPHQMDGQA
jgi:hypothetical protein